MAIRSSRSSRMLAGLDDFAYNHITQGFFKPLVLDVRRVRPAHLPGRDDP